MDLSNFTWSVIASIVAAVIMGAGAVTIYRNKTRNNIKQTGNNNNAIQNSTININSPDREKKENQ